MTHQKDNDKISVTPKPVTTPPDMAFEPVINPSDVPDDSKLPQSGQGGVDEKPVEAEGGEREFDRE